MSDNNKSFEVQNGLNVSGDITSTGSVTATAFFGDGSGLTNVTGGSSGGLSSEAVTALIVSTVDETYVQNHSLDLADVTAQINSIVDQAYVVARQTGLTELEVTNAVNDAINSRLSGLEWNFSRTVSAPNFQEGTHTLSSAVAVLQPSLGSLQTHSLSADSIYTAATGWDEGESLTLHISNTGGHLVIWPNDVKWVGGSAPTCTTVGVVHLVNFWKVGTQLYGAYVGEAS